MAARESEAGVKTLKAVRCTQCSVGLVVMLRWGGEVLDRGEVVSGGG